MSKVKLFRCRKCNQELRWNSYRIAEWDHDSAIVRFHAEAFCDVCGILYTKSCPVVEVEEKNPS